MGSFFPFFFFLLLGNGGSLLGLLQSLAVVKDTVELGQSGGGNKDVDGEQAVVLGDNDQ
jgi:hypothetical protein